MSVYWITGLSGAGKTTIGRQLYKRLKESNVPTVFLDGDELRTVFGDTFGYTLEERLKCSVCYSRLCKMLAAQGLIVVCCTVSMFDSVRNWNRENIQGYVEIYIKTSHEELERRNQKGLYLSKFNRLNNVVGVDLKAELPKTPDIVIENNGDLLFDDYVSLIIEKGVSANPLWVGGNT